MAVFITMIRPLLAYASPVWGGLPEYLVNEIHWVQNRSCYIIESPRNTLPTLAKERDKAAKTELQRILADMNLYNFGSQKIDFNIIQENIIFMHVGAARCKLFSGLSLCSKLGGATHRVDVSITYFKFCNPNSPWSTFKKLLLASIWLVVSRQIASLFWQPYKELLSVLTD